MKQQINEIKRMQLLAGIITESQLNEYDEEGSGYSYEYKEGPGASPKEIADTIKQYQKDKFTWEKLAKNDFYSMADGESADIKSEYYPQWKKSDFQQVIDALEGGSTSIKENEEIEAPYQFNDERGKELYMKYDKAIGHFHWDCIDCPFEREIKLDVLLKITGMTIDELKELSSYGDESWALNIDEKNNIVTEFND